MIPRLAPAIGWRELLLVTVPARFDAVQFFEDAFASRAGAWHAIAFPYGRTALICLLEALGLANKEIICPSYTCVVVPHAIVFSGNQPVFVDCTKESFLMDVDLASESVTDQTGALIATSFFGEPVDLKQLALFRARNPGVFVIQDCAHSYFCEHEGRPVHKFGEAAIYGTNVSKLVTSVFGGMVTTDDDKLAAAVRRVRAGKIAPPALAKDIQRRLYFMASTLALQSFAYGLIRRVSALGLIDRFTRYYSDVKIDMPGDYLLGMTNFEAEVGIRQIARYDAIIAHRRRLANYYTEALGSAAHLQLPHAPEGATWSHYVVRTPKASAYRAKALKEGIELGDLLEYFIPEMPVYRGRRILDRGIARDYVGKVVNLPLHMSIDDRRAYRVVALMQQEI